MSKGDGKLPERLEKRYGSYKVSEFTHGQDGYELESPTESDVRVPTPDDALMATINDQMEMETIDFKKRYTLAEKKKQFKQEYKTASESLREISPLQWKKQMEIIKGLTPEEYETVLG